MELLFGARDEPAFQRMVRTARHKYDTAPQIIEREGIRLAATTIRTSETVAIGFNGQLNQHDPTDLPRLFEQHGRTCFRRLDGHFRIVAIMDDGTVLAGTDHMGARQLFYTDKMASFSSHLVPMLAADGDPRLDHESMRQFLINGNNFTTGPRTMIEGITKVLPGHWRRSDGTAQQYHRLTVQPDDSITLQEAADRGYEALQEAVSSLLGEDSTAPYLLSSGGMDSALLAGLFDEQASTTTLTYGWEPAHFTEGRELADQLGIAHEELHIDYYVPDQTDAYFLEEPHSMFLNFPIRRLKEAGYEQVTSGLLSPCAFPIGVRRMHELRHAERVRPLVRAANTVGLNRLAEHIDPSYRIGLEAVSDEHDTAAYLAHNTFTITTSETRALVDEQPEQDQIQAVEDRWYHDDWYERPIDHRFHLLQVRQRDAPKYHNIYNQIEHHDLFTQRSVLETQLRVPMQIRRGRTVMDRIMADRFPAIQPDPDPSGYSAWIDIFWNHMASDQEFYRQQIDSFLERGWLDPSKTRSRVLDPTDYRYKRFGGVIVFLENWMETFIDRDEPWRSIT